MKEWLTVIGAAEFANELPLEDLTDADALIGVSSKRCYNSYSVGLNPNVTKIRSDWAEYLGNVLKSGHGSVTEHASWTWAIEGLTRVCTAELNRHRAGVAISEQSLRYVRFAEDGIDYWEPLCWRASPEPKAWTDPRESHRESDEELADRVTRWRSLEEKKRLSRDILRQTFELVERQYRLLCDTWREELAEGSTFAQKKLLTSAMRRIVPLGVCTGAVYTLNARALRHVMTMRCSPSAEEEICLAFGMIAKRMVESEPKLFGDFELIDNKFWKPKHVKV
jgi:thymidylate synthase (FAD)